MVEAEERAVLGPLVTRTRPPLLPQEEGGKRCRGWREGGWAERRRRKDSQLASELSFELTNEFMPRAQCLATREGH